MSTPHLPRAFLAVSAVLLAPHFGYSAPVIGQIDTFEDGTTAGWVVGTGPFNPGHPAPPQNLATGGPSGAGDNFLSLTALGGGNVPGGRLSVINHSQWAGDFISAGIMGIRMDVWNFGLTDLALRLLFADPAGGPPTNVAISNTVVHVSAGGTWTSVLFPIVPSELTALAGSSLGALSNATELRLFHGPDITFPGPPIIANLGVDNIEAVGVLSPDPSPVPDAGLPLGGIALLLSALAAAGRRADMLGSRIGFPVTEKKDRPEVGQPY